MSNHFPRRLPRPGMIQYIWVTFLPPDMVLAMRDEENRVFIWAREGSPLLEDAKDVKALVSWMKHLPPYEVFTPTGMDFIPMSRKEAARYVPSLTRYIQRGVEPAEESMLIIAYGFLFGPDHPALRDALAGVLTPVAA